MVLFSFRSIAVFQFLLVLTTCYSKQYSLQNFNLAFIAKNIIKDDLDTPCTRQLKALNKTEDALLLMTDAWSKFPYPGALKTTREDYGDYDECIGIEINDSIEGRILGKHCTFGLVIPDFLNNNSMETAMEKSWKLSYCIPDQCNDEDLTKALGFSKDETPFNSFICSTKDLPDWDVGSIITLVLIVLITTCMIISTLHDVYLHYSDRKNTILISRSFSILENGKKILSTVNQSKEQILCFHGLKFIGMWWIIAGHNGAAYELYALVDEQKTFEWEASLKAFYLTTGHLAVDTFFYISGFLLSYLYFKSSISKTSMSTQFRAVPSMIIHRYLRLTPAILVTFLVTTFLIEHFGNGPLYHFYSELFGSPCKTYWWSVFLYIQNYYVFYKLDRVCITSLWYVSADMQLFLISPFIIIPVATIYRKSFKVSMAILLACNLFFVAFPIFTKLMWRDYDPMFNEYDTHSRLTCYFIGVMFGIYIRHEKTKMFRFSTATNLVIWILTLTSMLGILLITQYTTYNSGYVVRTISLSFARCLWCVGLCWITFACFFGRGGIVNFILSNAFMQVGGKFTYSLYLVHFVVISVYAMTIRQRKYSFEWTIFYDWCGNFIVSMVFAVYLTLSCEYPMLTLERALFRTERPKAKAEESPSHPNQSNVK